LSDRLEVFENRQDDPQRLDKFLVKCLPEFSRSRLQGLVKDGFVLVDGVAAEKSGQMIERGMTIQVNIPPPAPSELVPEAIPLVILYENDDLMVINKPAGMVVHPAAGHQTGTLVHAALSHVPELAGIGGEQRPGVVHRLDKDTSGILLLAKNDRSHRWLQEQFRSRRTEKVYLALVDGHPPTAYGRIEASIGRSSAHRQRMAIVPAHKGREAITEYHTLETFSDHALLEVHPITGRTHQIRLHLSFLGCPVAGDHVYGHKRASLPIERQFLHATRLSIRLPGESHPRTFEAPLPVEMQAILNQLRSSG
jgi:23S rRNA pseudouridine1911/1915/1917 synthase